MRRSTLEMAGFVVSISFLAFLYGFGVAEFGWFPNSFLQTAADQARNYLVSRTPAFLGPRVYDEVGASVEDAAALQPGSTLLASAWRETDWTQGLRLVDAEGRTLHHWSADPLVLFPDGAPGHRWRGRWGSEIYIHGAYLFPDGDVLVNIEHVGTARLDPCGNVEWALAERTHHSIARADDGSFWIPTSRYVERPRSEAFPDGYPGLGEGIFEDAILHVSESGEVLGDISVLELLHRNGLQRYIFKVHQATSGDILHVNDVEPLPAALAAEYPLFEAGDLLVSVRNPHLVLVFDPESGQVRWHASDPFVEQHDPDFIGGGWIGVFDNNQDGSERGDVLGGSRIVALQPHTDSLEVVFPTPRAEPFYTSIMGKWQRLENGNLLLTEAMAGRVVEVEPTGQTVWEWVSEPYDDRFVPHVTEGTRYPIGVAEVAGWACHGGAGTQTAER